MKLTAGKKYYTVKGNCKIVWRYYAISICLFLSFLFCLSFAEAQCPSITLQPQNQTDCNGNQVNFIIGISGGVSPYNYAWYYKRPTDASFSLISTMSSASVTNTFAVLNIGNSSAPDGTQYYVAVTDANNCNLTSNTATLTVNEITGIAPSAQNISICQGGSYTLTASTTGSVISYQWTLNGSDITAATSATLNITNATSADVGSYKVRVVFNVAGAGVTTCQRTSQLVRNITVITPSISGYSTTCANSSGKIYTTEGGKTNYNWAIVGGTINSGNSTNSVSVTWNSPGTGVISVSYTDPIFNCTTTPTFLNVTINPLPTPIIIYHN